MKPLWIALALVFVLTGAAPAPVIAQSPDPGARGWWLRTPPIVTIPWSANPWPVYTSVAVDAHDPNVILAGTASPRQFDPGGQLNLPAGVYRSGDGGLSWARTFSLPADTTGAFVFTHPTLPGLAFVGVSRTHSEAGAGLYRSTDGGQTWTQVVTDRSFVSLSFSLIDEDLAYLVVIETGQPSQLQASTDRGLTWAARSLAGDQVVASPFVADEVYVVTNQFLGSPVRRSVDGGRTWAPVAAAVSGSTNLYLHPDDRNRQYLLPASFGMWFTDDGGEYWFRRFGGQMQNSQTHAPIGWVGVDRSSPDRLWAVTAGTIVWSTNDGLTWQGPEPGLSNAFWPGQSTCTMMALAPAGQHVAVCNNRIYVRGPMQTLYLPALRR